MSVADTKFELCRNVEQVLKIGRDFQSKDSWRGEQHDTAKLLCDTIEYLRDQLPEPDPDWKATCAKCRDGDIEPDCEYYGEPNGCNSPIYGEHPKSAPVGNSAAMREALESFCAIAESDVQELVRLSKRLIDEDIYGGGIIQKLVSDIGKARAALALPRRQCDVGTADEQAERFENFCLKHIYAGETVGMHCVGCPLVNASKNVTQECGLYWAQMPYEEGDNA